MPVSLPPNDTPAPKKRFWWLLGSNFLAVSILVHLLFIAGAAYLIVQTISSTKKPAGTAASAPSSTAAASREHAVKMQKKQQTMSAPAQMKRVTSTATNTNVALPAMPAMPTMATSVSPVKMAGMTGAGPGVSIGGGNGPGGGNGRPVSLFGLNGNGTGLEGTFYDYKIDQDYQPISGVDNKLFAKIVHDVLPSGGAWHPDRPFKHFTSPAKLNSRYFMFPAIQDNEAGAAFQSPRSGPGSWLAVYRGTFSARVSGRYRFVGFGDNVMIVKVGDRVVLDASDHNYTGVKREVQKGEIAFPSKGGTPLCAGQWMDLTAGSTNPIEIAIGDEGGIFCSGLFIQANETPLVLGDRNVPKLPVFVLGNLTDSDRELLGKAVPPECLQGPFFNGAASRAPGDVFGR